MRRTFGVWAFMIAGALATAMPAGAAVICKKKSGAMVIREACKAKETSVDLAEFGAVGPQGPTGPAGPQGPAGLTGGGVKGWAVVDDDGAILMGSHISAVDKPAAGVFCLDPDDTIDAATSIPMVSVEWYHSSGFDLLAQVSLPVDSCPEGTFEVKTYDLAETPSDNVAFVLVVF